MWTKMPTPAKWAYMRELGSRSYVARQTFLVSMGTVGAGTLFTFALQGSAPTARVVIAVGAFVAVLCALCFGAEWRAGERAYAAHRSA